MSQSSPSAQAQAMPMATATAAPMPMAMASMPMATATPMTSMPMPTATAEPFVPPTLQNGTVPPGETEPLRSAKAYDGWYPVFSFLFLVPMTLDCYHQRAKDDATAEVTYLCCCCFCIPFPCAGRDLVEPVEWRREGKTNKFVLSPNQPDVMGFVVDKKMHPFLAFGPGKEKECDGCRHPVCFQEWRPCKLDVCSSVATTLKPICRCRWSDSFCDAWCDCDGGGMEAARGTW